MPATRKHLHVSKPRRRQRSVSLDTRASRCGVKNYLNVMRSLHPDEKRDYFPVTVDYMQEYIGTKKRQGSIKANSLDQYFQHIESYNLALGHGWDSTVFEPMMREVLEELECEEKKNPENEEKKKKKAMNGGENKRKPKKQQQQQQQEGDQPQGAQQQDVQKQSPQSTPQQNIQQQQQGEQQQKQDKQPEQQQQQQQQKQQVEQQQRGQQGGQQQGVQQPPSHQPQQIEQQQRQQHQKHQRQAVRQRETLVTSDPMQVDDAQPQPVSGHSIEFKIDVLDDNVADQTAVAGNKPPLTIGTGIDPPTHLEPLTPRKSPPRSALDILTDYTESGTPSPTFQPQHQLKAVTIRSQNKIYRNNVAVTDTTTFGSVLSYAINKSPPPGKQFVLRSTDGDLEYMPDALVRKVINGPVHADVVVTIEDVRDVDFNHF